MKLGSKWSSFASKRIESSQIELNIIFRLNINKMQCAAACLCDFTLGARELFSFNVNSSTQMHTHKYKY